MLIVFLISEESIFVSLLLYTGSDQSIPPTHPLKIYHERVGTGRVKLSVSIVYVLFIEAALPNNV